ncbi:MAG: peptidoglycan-binding protein, partial [Acidimicrobiales bacterium]
MNSQKPDRPKSRLARRSLLAGAFAMALAAAATSWAASRISSPQQAAADARAPAPSVITATVEH